MSKKICNYVGTYQLGEKKSLSFLKEAILNGERHFDTAPSYGTERLLGQAIKWAIQEK